MVYSEYFSKYFFWHRIMRNKFSHNKNIKRCSGTKSEEDLCHCELTTVLFYHLKIILDF